MVHEQQLTEKLRPTSLKHIILLDRIRKSMGEGTIEQNLIFAGKAGIGKCVLGNTLIKIRDKQTGEIKIVKIEEFFNDTYIA